MVIELIVIGKTTEKYLETGIAEYLKRLSHYIKFDMRVIPELKNAKSLRQEQIKEKEGESIMALVSKPDHLVLLDENGKQHSSEQFAEWLQGHMNRGLRKLIFVVGGAYGFSEAVYARADQMLSLSAMTFSHQMVRLIFAEQLYRSLTILSGEPYHHK